jgi:hypothetical protein
MRTLFVLAGAGILAAVGSTAADAQRVHLNARGFVDINRNGIADIRERRIDVNRNGIDDRFEARFRLGGSFCPPGLAKKNNGCLPPGIAKRDFTVGQRVPLSVRFGSIPLSIRDRFDLSTRDRFIIRDRFIFVVDPGSRRVTRVIDLSR